MFNHQQDIMLLVLGLELSKNLMLKMKIFMHQVIGLSSYQSWCCWCLYQGFIINHMTFFCLNHSFMEFSSGHVNSTKLRSHLFFQDLDISYCFLFELWSLYKCIFMVIIHWRLVLLLCSHAIFSGWSINFLYLSVAPLY